MSRAAQLRSELESSLEQRIPAAFSPQTRSELPTVSTGIPALDALLEGGLPVGAITEIIGTPSSGRSSCANSFIAEVMRAGQVCAWIDVSDSFDPETAAGNGILLDRLLWVRCGGSPVNSQTNLQTEAPAQLPVPDSTFSSNASAFAAPPLRSGGSPHPRSEVLGLPEALDALLSRKPLPPRRPQIGTPGAPNRSLNATERVEQVAYDRLPSRRGSYLLQQGKDAVRQTTSTPAAATPKSKAAPPPSKPSPFQRQVKPWDRLDQALRAADLIMQAGGFGALVLDLGGIDPQFASRVPLATWFRFRAAAERSRTAFLLLTQHPCAQSSAEVVLRTSLSLPQAGTVLTSIPFTVERLRQRFTPSSNVISMRKPPQRTSTTTWQADTLWSVEVD